MEKTFQTINIPRLPVLATEVAIKQIRNNLNLIVNWKNIYELIPKFYSNKKMLKTGIAGILAASLELAREGVISIMQKKISMIF